MTHIGKGTPGSAAGQGVGGGTGGWEVDRARGFATMLAPGHTILYRIESHAIGWKPKEDQGSAGKSIHERRLAAWGDALAHLCHRSLELDVCAALAEDAAPDA